MLSVIDEINSDKFRCYSIYRSSDYILFNISMENKIAQLNGVGHQMRNQQTLENSLPLKNQTFKRILVKKQSSMRRTINNVSHMKLTCQNIHRCLVPHAIQQQKISMTGLRRFEKLPQKNEVSMANGENMKIDKIWSSIPQPTVQINDNGNDQFRMTLQRFHKKTILNAQKAQIRRVQA